jgi:cytoskeletal protein CcmA (bactofilin family)
MSKFSIADVSLQKHAALLVQPLIIASLVLSPGVASSASVTVTEELVPTSLDLTATGTTDWVSWVCSDKCNPNLTADANPYARKDVTPVIGDLQLDSTITDGRTAALRYLGGAFPVTGWTDGDPNAIWSGDNLSNPAGAAISSGLLQWCGECASSATGSSYHLGGLGTSFTFPVTATTRTLNELDLHLGGFRSEGTLTVTLGAETVTKSITFIDRPASERNVTLRIQFEADQVGDVLYAKWEQTQSGVPPYGTFAGRSSNLWIQAATLATEPDGDDDLVPNDNDQCPGTAPGDTVDVIGCSAVQLDATSAAAVNFNGSSVPGCSISGSTYTCAQSPSTSRVDISITDNYTITIGDGSGIIVANEVILGVGSTINGTLYATSTVALGANSSMAGDLTAGATVALGAGAHLEGDLMAETTVALGADAHVNGNLTAGTTVALGADAHVNGNLTAGTTVALGADASMTGNLTAGTTVALGADASVCGTVNAVTATLGAGAFVNGDLAGTTATLGASAYVNGSVEVTTATLGANACAGSIDALTTTLGAGAGICPIPRPQNDC